MPERREHVSRTVTSPCCSINGTDEARGTVGSPRGCVLGPLWVQLMSGEGYWPAVECWDLLGAEVDERRGGCEVVEAVGVMERVRDLKQKGAGHRSKGHRRTESGRSSRQQQQQHSSSAIDAVALFHQAHANGKPRGAVTRHSADAFVDRRGRSQGSQASACRARRPPW
ncbi:unnamed protein product [Lampetra fluviatilis]